MRLLVVCQHYWPETFQVTDVCEELAARGHDVTVLTGIPNYPKGYIFEGYEHGANRQQNRNGVDIVRAWEFPRGDGGPVRLAANYYSFSLSGKRLARKLEGHFDAVFAYQLSPVMMAEPAVEYAKANDVPLLLYCCDLWPESMKVVLGSKGRALLSHYKKVSGRLYQSADAIAVQSPAFIDYFDQMHGIGGERVSYVPQFATGEYLDLDLSRKFDGNTQFLIAGNVGRAQDMDVVLTAAEIALEESAFTLHIVGDGSMLDESKELARRLGLEGRVLFHGRRPNAEMPEWYRRTDACILALDGSTWVGTTLPSRLQGYMAAGKPVLAAIDGGARTVIVESGCGKAVSAKDAKGLAALMGEFCRDHGAFEACGERGREYFRRNFTRKQHVNAIENLLVYLVERNR